MPCPDGLVRGGDQKLHVSFAVLCTDFENVRRNLCTALRPNLRELRLRAGGGGGAAELKIQKSRSRYSATKIPNS